MQPELSGRGLFVFSDPGGAKPVLSYILLNKQIHDFLVVSDRSYDFYADFNIPVAAYEEGSETEIIKNFKPDFVFTGTSYTSSIELKFLAKAKEAGIVTYAFIDHYTSFIERFQYENKLVFPDHICLIDEIAAKIAVEKKLPGQVIITGNYYHTFLKKWKPVETKNNFLENLRIPVLNKIIVYAPDPLTNIGGREKWGLDEKSILMELLYVLKGLNRKDITLVIKQHPNQNSNILQSALEEYGLTASISDYKGGTNEVLFFSDLVIGIFSNILIEASLLQTSVIRCLIGLAQPDPFSDLKIGTVAATREELLTLINGHIVAQRNI